MKKVTTDLVETFDAIQEDGRYYGVLKIGDTEFREALPENIGQMPQEKQNYWMQKTIRTLKSRSKQAANQALAREGRKIMAARRVMQEVRLHQQLEALGVERWEDKPE